MILNVNMFSITISCHSQQLWYVTLSLIVLQGFYRLLQAEQSETEKWLGDGISERK